MAIERQFSFVLERLILNLKFKKSNFERLVEKKLKKMINILKSNTKVFVQDDKDRIEVGNTAHMLLENTTLGQCLLGLFGKDNANGFFLYEPKRGTYAWIEQDEFKASLSQFATSLGVNLTESECRRICDTLRMRKQVSLSSFDPPHLLGFANGVLDLSTGVFYGQHRSTFRLTQLHGFNYDPTAKDHPVWDVFLHTVSAGNNDRQRVLTSWLSLCLKQANIESFLFLLGASNGQCATLTNLMVCLVNKHALWGGDLKALEQKNQLVHLQGRKVVLLQNGMSEPKNLGNLYALLGIQFPMHKGSKLNSSILPKLVFGTGSSFLSHFNLGLALNNQVQCVLMHHGKSEFGSYLLFRQDNTWQGALANELAAIINRLLFSNGGC